VTFKSWEEIVTEERIDQARKREDEMKEELREAQAEARETLEEAEALEEESGEGGGKPSDG
jgi:signal transduction histidine kinase